MYNKIFWNFYYVLREMLEIFVAFYQFFFVEKKNITHIQTTHVAKKPQYLFMTSQRALQAT